VRQYEAVYIIDPTLEEDQQAALVTRFQDLVTQQGAEVQHVDRWERRRMAYEIKGRREGYYVVMNFRGLPAVEAELNRVLGITDGILRHMIVKQEERRAARAIADAKAAAAVRARVQAEAAAAAAVQAEAAAPTAIPVEAAAPAASPAEAPASLQTGSVIEDTGKDSEKED